MDKTTKRLSIIIPSYNDARIGETIKSVRQFDDLKTARLVIIDGGSPREVLDIIRPLLADGDIFISERDNGIFDALNKGLEACQEEFIGWIGSDDLFTGQVRSSDVVKALEKNDLFVTSLALFKGDVVRRITHALPSRMGLVKYGLNNPHYATFGRASLLKSERFRLDLLAADGAYFLSIFEKRPRIAIDNAVSVLAREGGFSSLSYRRIFDQQLQLFTVYSEHGNFGTALVALTAKVIYKVSNSLYHRVFHKKPSSLMTFGGVLGSTEAVLRNR